MGFPVKCVNGHPLKDVNERPCPVCGSDEAIVSMSALTQFLLRVEHAVGRKAVLYSGSLSFVAKSGNAPRALPKV